jgi:hypothetical protein
MTIRNGSTKDTDTEPQQPAPFTGGQYIASTALTKTSIGLAVAGAAVAAYSLASGCSVAAGSTGILLVLASAVVEGINLALAPGRVRSAPRTAGTQQALAIGGSGKKLLHPGEEWKITFGPNTRVVFCDPKTKQEQAASPLINNPNAVVELKDVPGGRLASGGTAFWVDVS